MSILLTETGLFVLGFLSFVLVHFIGDLFLSEILIAGMLPILLLKSGRNLVNPYWLRLFALLGLWLLSQIVSDAYNHTVLINRMRGVALITFFTIEIAFFAMSVARNERRKAILLTGYATGSIVMSRLHPVDVAIGGTAADHWKWGYATGVTILAVLISSFLISKRKRALALIPLLGVSAVDLLMNFRSAFLMLLVTIVLVFPVIPERIRRLRLLPRNNGLARVATVAMLALAAGWSANKMVHFVSQAGLVGEDAQQKNQEEAQAGNLLLGGRPEVFIGLRAAMDSPIIGHGSWARDMKYIEMQHDMLQEYGMEHDLADAESIGQGLIPAHSHIIGAWVFSGCLGALFWGYLFWLVLRAIVVAAVQQPVLAPVYVWLFVGYTWNIFFSPFGSTSRVIEAFTIVAIVDLLSQAPSRAAKRIPWRRKGAMSASALPPLQAR
jgi:hypothetical protein